MPLPHFPWKRFWVPRGGTFSLEDRGFLVDPEAIQYRAGDARPFEKIVGIPCLALLGEPGIGKSQAMKDEWATLEGVISPAGDSYLRLDLNEYNESGHLVRDLFESPEVKAWEASSNTLHLFLDSLDEGLLGIPQTAKILRSKLERFKAQIDRLQLRIACRTLEWPALLEEGLVELWGKEKVGVYELAPLRRVDVQTAAVVLGLSDPDSFLKEVEDREAQPLAIKPVTLRFLLDLYRREGHFPARQAELYSAGLGLLGEETSLSRRSAGQLGALSKRKRLAIAGRVAAVLVLCKKTAVCTAPGHANDSQGGLPIADVCGGLESVGADSFTVDEAEIREVLGTGLFSSRGPGRLAFAHQTYAEFLTARFLIDHGLETHQILSLIYHHELREVVPQLAETAAWLAGMRDDVFNSILEADPAVLLRSDVSQVTDETRARLVGRLLEMLEAETIDDPGYRVQYHRLNHAGLAAQLEPLIRKPPEKRLVREVAIRIAASCRLSELQDLLVSIALDPADNHQTRVEAVRAIAELGDASANARLRPLALCASPRDENDQLKGASMRALWPSQLTVDDLFGSFTPPQNEDYLGDYGFFLEYELPDSLTQSQLTPALRWSAGQANQVKPHSRFHRTVARIVVRVVRDGNEETVCQLADILATSSKLLDLVEQTGSGEELGDYLKSNEGRRQALLEALLNRDGALGDVRWHFSFDRPQIGRPEDLSWALDCLRDGKAQGGAVRNWAVFVRQIFNLEDTGHSKAVMAAVDSFPELTEEFESLLGPIPVDSEDAVRLRSHYLARLHGPPKPPLLDPPPAERVELCLKRFEAGEFSAWTQLTRVMTLEDDSTHYGDEIHPLLAETVGWLRADTATKSRIVHAARAYLGAQVPAPEQRGKWLLKNLSGYKAFCLLLTESLNVLDNLSSQQWSSWLPVFLSYPFPEGNAKRQEVHFTLVALAYQKTPASFLTALGQQLGREAREQSYLFVLRRLERAWDQRLCAAIMTMARRPGLPGSCLRQILDALFDQNYKEAVDYATRLVRRYSSCAGPQRERARAAGTALLLSAADAGWKAVWPSIRANAEFGRFVVEGLEYTGFRTNVAVHLLEHEVADFFLWLSAQYPHREDPRVEGGHIVSTREEISHFRYGLLVQLRERGTPAAVRELERIAFALPELPWLKLECLEAKRVMLRKTWIAPAPADFLTLVQRPGSRLVRNADELLEAIVASLGRLELELQGKPPAAEDLWDGQGPKDEGRLSDRLKRHLDADLKGKGIIALREVQIQKGEKTDLHVTGLVPGLEPGTWEPVKAIVEVKGCWHKEVKSAMKSQLVDRYLQGGSCRHGLYLVGWYRCDRWDKKDSRWRVNKGWSREQATKELAEQAQILSTEGRQIRAFVLDATTR